MLSHVTDLAEQIHDWEFVELWIDPIVFPPRILMLIGDINSHFCIYDPAEKYKLIFSSTTYDEVHSWLIEDEYERVDGRLLAKDIA